MRVHTGIVKRCSAQGAAALSEFTALRDGRVYDTVIPTVRERLGSETA